MHDTLGFNKPKAIEFIALLPFICAHAFFGPLGAQKMCSQAGCKARLNLSTTLVYD